MSHDALDRLELLFRAALLHPPEERAVFLEAACADDPALRRELASLLEADAVEEGKALIDVPAGAVVTRPLDPHAPETMAGQQIGPYQVLRRIGAGGMGDVYLALRKESFKRYVALKVIRRGMDTEEVLKRFEMERQILASLSHPNIAPLLDGGVTENGLPYFALEYVEGKPLTTYCDEHRLDLPERLRLFQTVCGAVHYAHQNLVIHRDLKPSNILVTGEGQVKLLDFGIAKLLNPNLSPVPVPITRETFPLMTPEYASPEQVRGEALTTASDVYSLGVLLYELLTGHSPYRLTRHATEEIIRAVREQDPERPSTRVTRADLIVHPDGSREQITPEQISEARDVSIERLKRRLQGDLDNIVLMALWKEPVQRYASAEQLSEDLERYLDGQPVAAHRATRRYRLQKFIMRHRFETVAAVLVLLSILSMLAIALWNTRQVARERDRTALALDRSEVVTDFLFGLFEANDPMEAQGDTITARELLARGIARTEKLDDQPVMQAQLLDVTGRVYDKLGQYEHAQRLLERALLLRRGQLGEQHLLVAESMAHLGTVLTKRGAYDEAESLLRHALTIQRAQLDEPHPEVIQTLMSLAFLLPYKGKLDEAERLRREVLAMRRNLLGPEHPLVANSLLNLATILRAQGRYDEAETFFRESLAMQQRLQGAQHPAVAGAMFQLAILLNERAAYDEAESLLRRALTILRAAEGDRHPDVSSYMLELGDVLQQKGDTDEAERLLQNALTLRRQVMGEHISTANALILTGVFYQQKGDAARAESLYRESLSMSRKLLGPEHQYVAGILDKLGLVNLDSGRYQDAETFIQQALGMYRKVNGPDHYHVGETLADMGLLRLRQGNMTQAEAYYREALAVLLKSHRAAHVNVQEIYKEMADLYDAWHKPEMASQYRARGTARK